MRKRCLMLLPFLSLSACQVVVKTPDGQTTTYGASLPRLTGTTPPATSETARTSAGPAALRSGLYTLQHQGKRKDGKGKLQTETANFRYLIDDAGNGRLLVQYSGEGNVADPGGMGGLMGGAAESGGIATLENGIWQWRSKEADGPCESRFTLESHGLKHLSGRCRGAGNSDALAWPPGNSVLRFGRALTASERKQLQAFAGAAAPVSAAAPAATPTPAALADKLVGQTFARLQLPYQRFGFDHYNSRLDAVAASDMPEGRVTVYPVRKGKSRYVLIAAAASNGLERVLEVREAAADTYALPFVAANPEGDQVTVCTLDGKPVSQVFAFAKPQGRGQFSAIASGKGENVWLVQPGGTRVIPLARGEKLQCRRTGFAG